MAKNNSVPDRIQAVWNVLGGDEGIDKILSGEIKVNLTPIAKAVGEYLESLGKVVFEIDQSVNPDEFLQTRTGLWVDSDLENWLGGTAEKIDGNVEVSKWKLKKNSLDKEIKSELPSEHIYTTGEFRTIIASAIQKQWGGKVGILRNDGYANIFYVWNKNQTKCFAVRVRWGAGHGRWGVRVYELEHAWAYRGLGVLSQLKILYFVLVILVHWGSLALCYGAPFVF